MTGTETFAALMPQLDTRNIAQVDCRESRVFEIAVICEGFRRCKQQSGVTELPQQSRYALQHRGVVIDDKNKVPIWQANKLDKSWFLPGMSVK